MRPFLKYPGNKYKVVNEIKKHFPKGKCLIEPFVGSGSVFLNTNYDEYVLSDINPHLINLYKILQKEGYSFISYVEDYFRIENNTKEKYIEFRHQFNDTTNIEEKSALFIYLNRHCFNGLVRYNHSGNFNVPFGKYNNPHFPANEMMNFYSKSQNATFLCRDFATIMTNATKKDDVIYCDPPYFMATPTSNFASFNKEGFNLLDQERLRERSEFLSSKGVKILISNVDTDFTRKFYLSANKIDSINVKRSISAKKSSRIVVKELLVSYN